METIHHSCITRPLPPTHLSSISTVLIIELESVSLPWLKAMAIPKSFIPFEDKNSSRETGKRGMGAINRSSIFQFPNELWLFLWCTGPHIKAFKKLPFCEYFTTFQKKHDEVFILKGQFALKKEMSHDLLSSAEHKGEVLKALFPCNYNKWVLKLSSLKMMQKHHKSIIKELQYVLYSKFCEAIG